MPPRPIPVPILLLVGSNIFMTFAWYGHLVPVHALLLVIILASWGIASSNTCCRCRPAGRRQRGSSAPRLKGMREVITACWCSPASRPGTSASR